MGYMGVFPQYAQAIFYLFKGNYSLVGLWVSRFRVGGVRGSRFLGFGDLRICGCAWRVLEFRAFLCWIKGFELPKP